MGKRQMLPAPDGMKRCYDCYHVKELSEFHQDKGRGDGKNPRCKSCMSDHMRCQRTGAARLPHDGIEERRREVDLLRSSAVIDGLKYCPKCEQRKPADEFSVDKTRPAGLAVYCKVCFADSYQAFREEKPDQLAKKSEYNKAYMRENREKYDERYKSWAQRFPEKHRAIMRRGNLKKKYDMTPEEYEVMFDAQGRRCANPGCATYNPSGETPQSRCFAIDHDHETGAIRGILCRRCNLALGLCDDKSRIAAGLAAYKARFEIGMELGVQ